MSGCCCCCCCCCGVYFLLVLLECNQDSTCCNEDFRVFPQVLQSFCDLVHFLSAAVSSSLPSGAFRQRGEETAPNISGAGGGEKNSPLVMGEPKKFTSLYLKLSFFCKKNRLFKNNSMIDG